MENIIEADKGMNIYGAILYAQRTLINRGHKKGYLVFNDIMIPLSIGSLSSDIARIYNLMYQINQLRK